VECEVVLADAVVLRGIDAPQHVLEVVLDAGAGFLPSTARTRVCIIAATTFSLLSGTTG